MKLSQPTAATAETDGGPGRRGDIANVRLLPDICEIYAVGVRYAGLPGMPFDSMRVVKSGRSGVDIATAPFEVPQALVKHPLTDAGFKRFADDWEEAKPHLGEILPSMQEA
jgi:transaldolase